MNNIIKTRIKKEKSCLLVCPNCDGANIIDITETIRNKTCTILDEFNTPKIVPLIEKNQRLFYCRGKTWRPFKQSVGYLEIRGLKRMKAKDYIDCDTEFLITFPGDMKFDE